MNEQATSTMKRAICLLMAALLAGGCKKEQVPEHELQQKRREQARERRRNQQKEEGKKLEARDAGVDHYRMWSPAVRNAFYALYRARSIGLPQKAQTLARLGMPAADALRIIATGTLHKAKKKALVSFMLVDLHMFRVPQLAKLAHEHKLPFVQRAAIESLARVGNAQSEAALDGLIKELPKMPLPKMPQQGIHGHGHGHEQEEAKDTKDEPVPAIPPDQHPMVRWVRHVRAQRKGKQWAYSEQQLATLDRILHADSPQKLRIAVMAAQGDVLEQGMRAILGTPVARESTKAGVAFKIVEPRQGKPRRLRQLCGPQEDQMVRLVAVRLLLESGTERDRAFIDKLAADPKDPMAQMLSNMLKNLPRKK